MAAVPTSTTFRDGVSTSSEMNSYVRDPIAFLLSKPAAELRQTVAQSIPNATFTSLLFDTEDLDLDPSGGTGGHSTSVNTSRYTAVYPGWYVLGGGYAPVLNVTGQRGTQWAVNGATVPGSIVFLSATTASTIGVPARVKRVYLNVGDYVELQAYQSSTVALNTEISGSSMSSFSIAWDRAA